MPRPCSAGPPTLTPAETLRVPTFAFGDTTAREIIRTPSVTWLDGGRLCQEIFFQAQSPSVKLYTVDRSVSRDTVADGRTDMPYIPR
jgi:hypothetical protein